MLAGEEVPAWQSVDHSRATRSSSRTFRWAHLACAKSWGIFSIRATYQYCLSAAQMISSYGDNILNKGDASRTFFVLTMGVALNPGQRRILRFGSHSPLNPECGMGFRAQRPRLFGHPGVRKKRRYRPIDWRVSSLVQYASVRDLRKARELGLTETSDPKAASQGSEIRIIWPSTVATSSGIVSAVEDGRIQYKVGTRTNTDLLRGAKNFCHS